MFTSKRGDADSPPPAGLAWRAITLDRSNQEEAERRGRPRFWHHDYLHLRPVTRDLRERIPAAAGDSGFSRVLDLGSGSSPYRHYFGESVAEYVRLDPRLETGPSVVGRAERIPFPGDCFDAVLASQVLGLVDDPVRVGSEIARVLRPGGTVWLSCPAAWPYDSRWPEHRFGAPDLPRLLPDTTVREIVSQGGMLALPWVVFNQIVREFVRACERRLGPALRLLWIPACAAYVLANGAGRLLEILARRGPLSGFLGYLDRRMPMNFLVVAEKNR